MKENTGLFIKRNRLVIKTEKLLEGPMILLGFIWLILLIIEFVNGFNPFLELVSTIIWIIFIGDFVLKLILAPEKLLFLRKNIITAISLIIPALRLFRIFRFIRLLRIFRGTRLIKVIASLNRGMKSLHATMGRRGFGYVMALTLIVILAGAAGMHVLENRAFGSFGVAIWWTTMLVITVGTDFWPKSAEGRILCTLLSLYGFGVFGYITATLASFFIGNDVQKSTLPAGAGDLEGVRVELMELKEMIKKLTESQHV